MEHCFKPYYNWNTFNTKNCIGRQYNFNKVLNLIITGIPSIPNSELCFRSISIVLNLIITGIPSIQNDYKRKRSPSEKF